MKVRFRKVSDSTHMFSCIWDDASKEEIELESRSFLMHDLIHFVVESEAKLHDSFYGKVAKGATFAELRDAGMDHTDDTEISHTERIVGPMTGVVKGDATPEQFENAIKNLYGAYDKEPPGFATASFAAEVKEKVTNHLAEWKRLSFGDALELEFAVD